MVFPKLLMTKYYLCLSLANLLFLVVGLCCLRTLQCEETGFFCFSLLATRAYLTLQFKPKTHLLHLPLITVVELLGILHLASYWSIFPLKLFFAFLLGLLVSIFFKKHRPRWGHYCPSLSLLYQEKLHTSRALM